MTNGLACKDKRCPSPLCGIKNWEAKSLSLVICDHYSQQVVVGSAGLAIMTQVYASLMGARGIIDYECSEEARWESERRLRQEHCDSGRRRWEGGTAWPLHF